VADALIIIPSNEITEQKNGKIQERKTVGKAIDLSLTSEKKIYP